MAPPEPQQGSEIIAEGFLRCNIPAPAQQLLADPLVTLGLEQVAWSSQKPGAATVWNLPIAIDARCGGRVDFQRTFALWQLCLKLQARGSRRRVNFHRLNSKPLGNRIAVSHLQQLNNCSFLRRDIRFNSRSFLICSLEFRVPSPLFSSLCQFFGQSQNAAQIPVVLGPGRQVHLGCAHEPRANRGTSRCGDSAPGRGGHPSRV